MDEGIRAPNTEIRTIFKMWAWQVTLTAQQTFSLPFWLLSGVLQVTVSQKL